MLNQRAEAERQKRQEKEEKELTFKPQIVASSKARAAVVREKGVKLEDVLLFQGKLANDRKEKLR
jgi:hypothetical protein